MLTKLIANFFSSFMNNTFKLIIYLQMTPTSLIEATAQMVVVDSSLISSNTQRKSLLRPLSCLKSISALGIV